MDVYKCFSSQNIWIFTSVFRPKKYENLKVDGKIYGNLQVFLSQNSLFQPKIYDYRQMTN